MKHFYNPRSRSAMTDWMLAELDVEHERVCIDFGIQNSQLDELHRINPMKKLPVLVDGDTVVTETAAICAYLADKYPQKDMAPAAGSAERGLYYRILFISGSAIEPAFTLAAANIEYPDASMAGWGDMPRIIDTIETLTPGSDWATGKQFTAADVIFGGLLDFASKVGWFTPSLKVQAYISRLRQRPAYLKSHPDMLQNMTGKRIA